MENSKSGPTNWVDGERRPPTHIARFGQAKRKKPPANDNREPAAKFLSKWVLRMRGILLPIIGAAILIYAMTH